MGRRPDPERIRRNAETVYAGAGETATLRTYVSATRGTPEFGVGPTPNFVESVVTGLFASNVFGMARPTERALAGGESQYAALLITTDRPIVANDELIWRGSAYRADGAPMPQVLGGRTMYRTPLRLAAATG